MKNWFLLVLSVFVFSGISTAQEWNRFRGPNGTGKGDISGLPPQINKTDYDWRVKLNGIGHSSPVLWGDKLFLTIYDPKKEERRLECYQSKSGKLLWQWNVPVDAHNLHKYNNFAAATPTADKDHVYLVWGNGEKTQATAINHKGKEVWQREWPAFSSDHGNATSPVLIGGNLVFHTDSVQEKTSRVVALNTADGETVWEVERVTSADEKVKHVTAYNTPVSVKSGDKETVVALQTNDGWKGIDPEDGKIHWAFPGDYTMRTVGSIAQEGDILFATFGSGGGGKDATALRINDTKKPEVLYELGIKDGLGYVPTPLIHKGRLFLWGDGGILTCRDAETGEEIYQERVNGNFFSSPILADGKIYCASRDGEIVCVAAEGPFQILGRSRLESGVNATPAVANNRLFVRTDTHLFSVKGK